MDYKEIKKIIKDFESSSLHKLSITLGENAVSMEKPPVATAVSTPVLAQNVSSANEGASCVLPEGTLVKAPLVGTYYDKPAPDAAPYVKVGDKVKKGQTLFIVEAMKVMNEISSPVDGTVTEILAENAQLLEQDQICIVID